MKKLKPFNKAQVGSGPGIAERMCCSYEKRQLHHHQTRTICALRLQPSAKIMLITALLSTHLASISTAHVHLNSLSPTTSSHNSTRNPSLSTTSVYNVSKKKSTTTTTSAPSSSAQSNSQYFIEHYYADSETHISSYKLNEFYEKYRPEVGIRTAIILGSMLLLIVLYILWKNRCRCFCSGAESSKADEELIYWLNHVENRNKKDRDVESWPQQLPAACADSKQATAAWVVQHRKLWSNLHARPKIRQHHHAQSEAVETPADVVINSHHPRLFKMNVKQSAQNVAIINRLMKPFRARGRRAVELTASKSSKLHFHHKNIAAVYKNHPNRLVEELDTSTQLLINYARIDAIDASHSVNFNKLTGGLTFIHHLNSSYTYNLAMSSGVNANQQTNVASGSGLQQQSSPIGTPIVASMLSSKRNVTPMNRPKPSGQDICGSSSQALNELAAATTNSNSNSNLNENDNDSSRPDMDVINEVLNMSSGVGAGLLQDFVTSMVHKRRTSWPRCRADHLQFFNYARDIRLFYNHHGGGGVSRNKQYERAFDTTVRTDTNNNQIQGSSNNVS
jgi:hypothetical protein